MSDATKDDSKKPDRPKAPRRYLPAFVVQEPLTPKAASRPFDGSTLPHSKSTDDLLAGLTDAERAVWLRRVQEILEQTKKRSKARVETLKLTKEELEALDLTAPGPLDSPKKDKKP